MNKSILQSYANIKKSLSRYYQAWILGVLMFVMGCAGMFLDYMSLTSSVREMPIEEFTEQLRKKEKEAREMLDYLYRSDLDKITSDRQVLRDELITINKAKEQGIEYFVFNDTTLTFWTGNELNIGRLKDIPLENEFYYRAANYHCVGVRIDVTNSTFIGLIKFKTAFNHEEMGNEKYVNGFVMPNHVKIVDEASLVPKIPILRKDGSKLMNIEKVPYRRANKLLKTLCGVSWTLCIMFILMFLHKLYKIQKARKITKTKYIAWVSSVLMTILIGAFIKQPLYLFDSQLFTPAYYHTEYSSSMGIVVLYTLVISTFYFMVIRKRVTLERDTNTPASLSDFAKSVGLQLFAALLAILLFFIVKHFVYHSKINVAVAFIQDITTPSIIAMLIIIGWYSLLTAVSQQLIATSLKPFRKGGRLVISGVSILTLLIASYGTNLGISHFYGLGIACLYGYASCSFLQRFPRMVVTMIYSILIINLSVGLANDICEERNHRNMKNLSEEIARGKLIQKDPFAEKFIAVAAQKARHDPTIKVYCMDSTNRSAEAEKYVRENFQKGYWERYDVDVQIVPKGGNLKIRTDLEGTTSRIYSQEYIKKNSFKIQQYTDFYLNENIHLPLSYMGKLKGDEKMGNEVVYTLYPSKKYRNMDAKTLNEKYSEYATNYEDISVAKYVNGKLQQWAGKFPFQPSADQLRYSNSNSYMYKDGNYYLYVTKYNDLGGKIVVANLARNSTLHLMLSSTLFGVFFFALMSYYLAIYVVKKRFRASLFNKSQCLMMSLMTFLFFAMIVFCGKFFSMQYAMQQKMKMTQRTMGVQSYLIQQIGYRNDLKFESPEWYQEILQNFGNVMRAHLILYDKNGVQYSASNQELFNYGTKNIEGACHMMLPEAKFPYLDNDGFPYIETIANKEFHSIYMNVMNEYNAHLGYIQLLDSVTGTADRTPAMNFVIILMDLFLLIIMIALISIWIINKKIASPLEELTERLKEFDLKGENTKITMKTSNDEIGVLVTRYNLLVDKLREAAKKLAKNERDAAWREMARSIAHEIKNPLTPIKLNIQLAQKKYEEDPENFAKVFPRTCERVIEQIDNLSRIATDFSDFAKVSSANHTKIDIYHSLRNVADLYAVNPEGVILTNEIPDNEKAFIMGEEKQLYQIFNNLIKNAIQAIPDSSIGVITIQGKKEDGNVLISIQDNGCGISSENVEKIFQPNFTTKNSGMGLGLAISKGIIENSGGMIWVESQEGIGTTFFIELPLINENKTNE